jgi:pyruvate,water dikinase
MEPLVIPFEKLRMNDVEQVGGKNSSLGEMISQLAGTGVRVPGGFATTAQAYRDFLAQSGLDDKINAALDALDVEDVNALAVCGAEIRKWIMEVPFPMDLTIAITEQYQRLVADSSADMSFAVRSSATAEDLPDASFAGQQESFLNIHGYENILHAIKEVFASLYNDRAIAYRVHKGFTHAEVALSAGVQRMVRSDIGASGVMFTHGHRIRLRRRGFHHRLLRPRRNRGAGRRQPRRVLRAQGHPGPGQAGCDPPQPRLQDDQDGLRPRKRKPASPPAPSKWPEAERNVYSLTDADVLELGRYAMIIEKHYGRPMDIEWGKSGDDGKLYILQARPETVKSQQSGHVLEKYRLKQYSKSLTHGRAIGQKIGAGQVRVVKDASEMDRVKAGDVLVTDMTDPNWEPVMKRASAIVTNRGGRTCHAAIIARELGIPAIVGCGNATEVLSENDDRHRHPVPKATPAMSTAASSISKSSPPIPATCRIFRSRS